MWNKIYVIIYYFIIYLGSILCIIFYFRFKNASIIKEYGSQITLCSNENINQKKIKTQNDLYNQNNTSQIEVKICTNVCMCNIKLF